jgi:protein TonB
LGGQINRFKKGRMAKDVNLMSQKWIDLVFTNKNKSYGAYRLRQSSGRRHLFAFITVMGALFVFILTVSIVNNYQTYKHQDISLEVSELSDIQLLPPEYPEEMIIPAYITPPPEEIKKNIRIAPPVINKDLDIQETYRLQNRQDHLEGVVNDAESSDIERIEERENDLASDGLKDKEEATLFTVVEEQPLFPGGNSAMAKFLNDNLYYPVSAQEKKIEGRVLTSFIVEQDGRITHIEVIGSIDSLLDKEAIRVIRAMPPWKPGKRQGQPVRVKITLPIVFRL